MATLRMTYYPDITQGKSEEEVHSSVQVFATALAEALSASFSSVIKIEVPAALEVPDQFDRTLAGGSELSLMKPVAYVFANWRNPAIVPACVAHRVIDGKEGVEYFGQVYCHRNLGVESLEELASKGGGTLRIAYGSRFSTSNFLIPALVLHDAGIHPFTFFRTVEFMGGHDLAVQAVYDGQADVGAGHDGVIRMLAEKKPDAAENLVTLGRQNIHSDPVVVHTGVLPKPVTLLAIQRAAVLVAKVEPVKKALDLFWGGVKDLSETTHARYAAVEQALARLHLQETDMLR